MIWILENDETRNWKVQLKIAKRLSVSIFLLKEKIDQSDNRNIYFYPDLVYSGMFKDLKNLCSRLDKSEESIKAIYDLCEFLLSLWSTSKKSLKKIMKLSVESILKNEPLTLFTANSKSISPESRTLRDKPQYYSNEFIGNSIESFINTWSPIQINYLCILPDYDEKLPIDKYDSAWEANLKQLQSFTRHPCLRLSSFVSSNDLSDLDIETIFENEINEFSKRKTTLISFHANEDFIKNQIVCYAKVGLLLEKIFPHSILLDIQKHYYPFEQPYYQRLRKSHLPIIYCGQKIKDR